VDDLAPPPVLRQPSPWRQYWLLLRAGIAIEAQYRGNFLLVLLGAVAYQGVSLAFVGVLVSQFGSIAGWGFPDIAFIYAIRMCAHGVMTIPLGQLWQTSEAVVSGEYDRYLLRPANPYLQLITRRFALAATGDIVLGIATLAVVTFIVPVAWTPLNVLYLAAAVLGGAAMEAATLTFAAALSFRFLNTYPLMTFYDSIYASFGASPLDALGKIISLALTFLVPLAFIAYFPATVLLGRTGELTVPGWLAGLAPVIGAVAYAAALRFFHRQTLHYTSSGH
jgi:ABC-2 type transport system permease protein